jgi:hypothetical protein
MPDEPQRVSSLSVMDAMTEAMVMDFHGNLEDAGDGCANPRIGRDVVEAELSFDLLDAEMRRSL